MDNDVPDGSPVRHGSPVTPSPREVVFRAPPLPETPVVAVTTPCAFVLTDEGGVLAYGLRLPDGSALTVQWSRHGSGAYGVWSSVETPAALWACAITWLGSATNVGPEG